MEFPRRRFLQFTGAAAFAPLAHAARADAYPSRVVKLLVGFPPGGGADLAARIVVNGLSEIWGQQVIVENRPGAGARLALDAVAHAPPDGSPMLLAPAGHLGVAGGRHGAAARRPIVQAHDPPRNDPRALSRHDRRPDDRPHDRPAR